MHIAKIEFLRIQSFLFSSYRLRAMLGANSLLGQVIRHDLVKLAREKGACPDQRVIPKLPLSDPDDPLSSAKEPLLRDDPQYLYSEYGVITRDGGHLQATFPDQQHARQFIEAAMEHVSKKLPGLLVQGWVDGKPVEVPNTTALLAHGAWQVCQRTGHMPASTSDGQNEQGQTVWVSMMQKALEQAGKHFRQNPKDLIGLLSSMESIPVYEADRIYLEDVSKRGYLAVIHADGNNIGVRFKRYMDAHCKAEEGVFREGCAEHFFHSMRVAVRRALTQALQIQFSQTPQYYQLLMLGGDDLLLVCDAADALPFVEDYVKQLERIPLADGTPLSIGAGVAIAKKKFPFYRLHTLAETLADSAKRYFRALQHKDAALSRLSVVDWMVTSQSWEEDAISMRRALYSGKSLCACLKPYPVLDEEKKSGHISSMHRIRSLAEQLNSQPLARSQLKRLQSILQRGDSYEVELAWRELPTGLKNTLKQHCIDKWYQGEKDHVRLSYLDDLIELMEIVYLGKGAGE